MANGAHDDGADRQRDRLGQLVGDAGDVRAAFEQMPVAMAALAGPEHRIVATNAAYRSFTGRAEVIGLACRDAFPELLGQQLYELFDRVYATGKPETGTEWRTQFDLGPGGIREVYADFTVVPQRDDHDAISGLLLVATNVTERVTRRQAEQRHAAEQQAPDRAPRLQPASVAGTAGDAGDAGAVGMVAELQKALLPNALPVLPELRIEARYLVAGHEQAAGGDWFDAVPLAGGGVALVVGDVVGHGVAASAAMGQLRAVLGELLVAEPDLDRVLARTDAFAARTPALQAATLTLAVFDPAAGQLHYTICGHPPPLVVGTDGKTRFLPGPGTGPLGTGSAPVLARAALNPGELLLLYSDGLIERPHKSIEAGLAELARVAADAAANRALGVTAASTAAERVCQLTVELLTRTGYADDVTTLAAERLAEPVPDLKLDLPGERASLTVARRAFSAWLSRIGATAEDAEALHLAMVEVVTNAIEHAYPPGAAGTVELTAALREDGTVECRIADHGTWRPPDPGDADRGHGLMVAGHVVDSMLVSHPVAAGGSPGGTVVVLRLRLRRPAVLASGHHSARAAARAAEPPFTVAASIEPSGAARALVAGPVDIFTADQLCRRLLSVSRGGTVPLIADLTGVTLLASAGVRALYLVREQLTAHHQALTLITAPGSSTNVVLDLVRLGHTGG